MAGITWQEFLDGYNVGNPISNTLRGCRLKGTIAAREIHDGWWGTITCTWAEWREDKPGSRWKKFPKDRHPVDIFVIGIFTQLYKDNGGGLRYGHMPQALG